MFKRATGKTMIEKSNKKNKLNNPKLMIPHFFVPNFFTNGMKIKEPTKVMIKTINVGRIV